MADINRALNASQNAEDPLHRFDPGTIIGMVDTDFHRRSPGRPLPEDTHGHIQFRHLVFHVRANPADHAGSVFQCGCGNHQPCPVRCLGGALQVVIK